jgi:hypothetical protein
MECVEAELLSLSSPKQIEGNSRSERIGCCNYTDVAARLTLRIVRREG